MTSRRRQIMGAMALRTKGNKGYERKKVGNEVHLTNKHVASMQLSDCALLRRQ